MIILVKVEEGGVNSDELVLANLTTTIGQGQAEIKNKLVMMRNYIDQRIEQLIEEHLNYED